MATLQHDQLGYRSRDGYHVTTDAHAPAQPGVPVKEVWSLLQPAIPDCLKEVAPGVYEVRWWKPVPMMDVEIVLRTEGIIIKAQPYEPAQLPNGLAIRFTLTENFD